MTGDGDPRPSAEAIAHAVASGEMTAAGVLDTALATIDRTQPLTNAFSAVFADEARKWAQTIDGLQAIEPARPGLLQGVPVAVKDLFDVKGHLTTGSSRAYEDNHASADATVIQRLRDAGAVIVGKTNQHELAMGGTNLLSMHGPTHNPFDPQRITGGSSGGSAAAVATGCVPIALGSDTGGSIRNPAMFCGLFGLKPTQGSLPLDGVMALAPSMDCPGPLAATIGDLRLAWMALSGSKHAGSEPGRVGLLGGSFDGPMHPEVRLAIARVVEALRERGVEVVPLDPPGPEPDWSAWASLVCVELVEAHPELADRVDLLFPRTAGFVARGLELAASDAPERLRKVPTEAHEWFERCFDGVDLLLAPSAPYPAPRADQDEVDVGDGATVDVHLGGTSRFTRPVNLAGAPAITIPAGRAADGMPVGVQLIARWGAEEDLIAVGAGLAGRGEPFVSPVPPSALG